MLEYDFTKIRSDNNILKFDIIVDGKTYTTIKIHIRGHLATIDFNKDLPIFNGLEGSIIISEIFNYILCARNDLRNVETFYDQDSLNFIDEYGINMSNRKNGICYSYRK